MPMSAVLNVRRISNLQSCQISTEKVGKGNPGGRKRRGARDGSSLLSVLRVSLVQDESVQG